MENVPRMSRVRRRHLMQLGRKSGDPDTMLRFVAVAQLGLGKKSPEVARDLAVARSTVVKAAKAFASEGVSGLYDRRKRNGEAKVTDGFRRRVDQILRTTPEDFRLAPDRRGRAASSLADRCPKAVARYF